MRDEVVRIILEVKDKGSAALRNFERNVKNRFVVLEDTLDNFGKKSDKLSTDVDRNLNKSASSMKNWSNSIRGHLRNVQDTLSKTRSEFERTNIAFGKVERGGNPANRGQFSKRIRDEDRVNFIKEIKEAFHGEDSIVSGNQQSLAGQLKRLRQSTPFTQFREGRQAAAETESLIRSQIAATKEEVRLKRQELEEELRVKKEILIQEQTTAKQILEDEISAKKKANEEDYISRHEALQKEFADRQENTQKDILARHAAFEKLRAEEDESVKAQIHARQDAARQEIYERQRQFIIERNAIREADHLSRTQKDLEIAALTKAKDDENKATLRARDDQIRAINNADDALKKRQAAARDADIAKIEKSAARIRAADKLALEEKIAAEQAEQKRAFEVDQANQRKLFREQNNLFTRAAQAARRAVTGEGESGITAKALADTKDLRQGEQDVSRLGKAFRSAGVAFGDFRRGITRGRSDLREVDKLAREADTAFSRFGQTIGRFTKNIGNLVNLRWYLLISAVQILGQLVLVLAANLVSLASSAAVAAAALGAGLTAAISQAIPVVGLLYAAFSRVTAAFTAAQQATKANAQSSQDARAQAQAQTAAQQQLTDALYAQKQAVQQLADARRQARRDIVDALNAEIDANYALKDAEFAVLDAKQQLRQLELQNKQDNQAVKDAEAAVTEAKQRLAAAKKEGDQAEISAAQQQLAIAKQNLADAQGQSQTQKDRKRQVDEQKLAVKEAEQQLKEARIAQKRQQEDTARTIKLGVKGNQQVVDALHGVATANREVANAQTGVKDAMLKQASAGNLLQRQLSQLDPAEKALYKTFVSLRKTIKSQFRPVTDIIVDSINDAIKRIIPILKDPKFINAFKELAIAIGKGIQELSKFFTSRGFISDFEGFIHQASKNIPYLIKIIENLTKSFLGLAKAGQPVVKDILERVAKVTGSLSKAINEPAASRQQVAEPGTGRFTGRSQTRAQQFIGGAAKVLNSWIKLGVAIARVFKFLIIDAAPAGTSLVGSLTNMFNALADFLKKNPEKVNHFFETMKKDLVELAGVLFPLVKVLGSAFTGENATQFTKFTAEVVLPGIALMIQFLGFAAKVLLFLTKIPGIKFFLQFLVFEKALNRIFPATQKVTDAAKKLGGWFFKVGEDGTRGITKVRGVLVRLVLFMRTTVIPAMINAAKAVAKLVWQLGVAAVNASKNFAKAMLANAYAALKTFVLFITETVIPALYELGVAMFASLGPWGLIAAAVIALIAGIVLLLRHFHLLQPILHFFENVFKDIFNWVKAHWKLLIAILLAPFAAVVYGIYKFRHEIYNAFKSIINFIKDHWKGLAQILIAIFLPGGIIIAAIWKWHDKILNIAKKVVKGIGEAFTKLPHLIIEALKFLPNLLIKLFKDVGKKIGKEIFSWVPKQLRGPLSKALGISKDILGGVADAVDPLGVRHKLGFADGGKIPGPPGKAVPIVAHAGEWVLNKSQQMKLAQKLKESTEQVSAFLFGTNQGKGKPSQGKTGRPTTHHKHGSTTKSYPYGPYNLVSVTDQDSNIVWFIELDDQSFAGVTPRDAAKIQKTHGKFIPKYIRRDAHGFTKAGQKALKKAHAYAMGGIVMPDYNFAMGGVVNSPQSTYGGASISKGGNVSHKKIEQNFQVNTQGETDWNYVMRLAAMHAQASY